MLKPTSGYWRERAEEYRSTAESYLDDHARRPMLQLAISCESLAERQEQVAEYLSSKARSKPS
jgi:hypothetical protein